MRRFGVLALAIGMLVGCAQVGSERGTASTAPTNAVSSMSTSSHTPQPSYAQRIRAAIIPYVVLVEPMEGNPTAEVRVTIKPDGEVIDAEVVKSSGYSSWDKSVRIAVLKAGRIPLDTDGKVPRTLYISFRPNP